MVVQFSLKQHFNIGIKRTIMSNSNKIENINADISINIQIESSFLALLQIEEFLVKCRFKCNCIDFISINFIQYNKEHKEKNIPTVLVEINLFGQVVCQLI